MGYGIGPPPSDIHRRRIWGYVKYAERQFPGLFQLFRPCGTCSSRVHLFSGIAYCGKCGNKMVSTTGKLCVDGYRPSNCSCPKRRKTKDCDNQTINDSALGEFVIISEGPGNRKPLFSRKSNNSAKKKNARNGLCRDSRNSTCILNLQCGKSKKNPWIP